MSDRHASSAGPEVLPETVPEPRSSSSTFPRRLQITNLFSTICDSFLSPILFLFHFLRKILCGRSDSAHHNHVNRIAYSVLHRATSSFSDQTLIGRGGFGSVYRGFHPTLKQIAVKVMDSGSLQGEREFQNELFFAQKINQFEGIVTPIGYSYNRRRRRVLLVYNLMENGNLQDALLRRKCAELMEWERRYSVALDIGKGIEFLHSFDPPIIHGDIKPSNILLDQNFKAKIGDFGLARMKTDVVVEVNLESDDPEEGKKNDCTGIVVDNPQFSVEGSADEFSVKVNQYPECTVAIDPNCLSSDAMEAGGSEIEGVVGPVASPSTVCSEGNADKESVDGKREISGMRRSQNRKRSLSRMDWWWRQDSGSIDNGTVKDYVMDWLGGEIRKENTKKSWVEASPKAPKKRGINWCRKKIQKKMEWWKTMEKNKSAKKVRRRPKREWWKEEFCEELTRKKKKKKKKKWKSMGNNELNWWERDEEVPSTRKKRSGGSIGSMDWWWDGFSGELWRARRHSFDSVSGDIPKSGGVSSTPSMRGTVCYIAPEYGVGGDVSEKCDVYSYGVLLLVLVAGRRPLEVTGSPLSEFQRANLMSWARRLARSGKLLDLLDQSMESLDQDQAILCITVALMCLQKSPSSRPSMKQVYGMLSGELPRPQLPVEFSPSPPSRFPFKYQRKVKASFGTE